MTEIPEDCPGCGGWGFKGDPRAVARGYGKVDVTVNTCPVCSGTGRVTFTSGEPHMTETPAEGTP
jgi:hypothetical protein